MPELETTPNSNDNPLGKPDGLVFDVDDDFSYDADSGSVLDEDGNWVENDTSSLEATTDQQTDSDNRFGDNPILFAEYAIAGIRAEALSKEHPEEAALYKEWLGSLDEDTKLIINERKRAQGRYDVVKSEMLKSCPDLLQGKLPAEQSNKLGSDKYVLGVNQSQAFSIEDAKFYLEEDNGIGLGIYGLDQRFLLLDEASTKDYAEYTEQVMVGGYYQNSNIGRFIIAVPTGEHSAVQDAVNQADAIADFIQQTNEAGGRSVSPKYIAGFVDSLGVYHENRNFGVSNEPLFGENHSREDTPDKELTWIDYRERLLDGYGPFSEEVDRIRAELVSKPAKELESFVASGNESDVFKVESRGKFYAVRISKIGDASSVNEHIESYVEGPYRAIHIDGMEKLVGVSYEKGVTVAEMMPGRPMAEYSAEEIAAIPREHYKKLAVTVVEAAKAGISLDGNEGNLLYDAELGFGFVDFGAAAEETLGIAQPVTASVFGTDTWLPSGKIPVSGFEEDYIVLKDVLAATIPAYEQWLDVLFETQEEMGLDADYLTRLDELKDTLIKLRSASEELTREGTIGLVKKSRLMHEEMIGKLQNKITNLEPGFMRANVEETLSRRTKAYDARIFTKGGMRSSRNDSKV